MAGDTRLLGCYLLHFNLTITPSGPEGQGFFLLPPFFLHSLVKENCGSEGTQQLFSCEQGIELIPTQSLSPLAV